MHGILVFSLFFCVSAVSISVFSRVIAPRCLKCAYSELCELNLGLKLSIVNVTAVAILHKNHYSIFSKITSSVRLQQRQLTELRQEK